MRAKPLIVIALIAAAAYVGFIVARQVSLLKSTGIKIISYKLNGIFTRNASLYLLLKITNNSDIDLQAKSGSFDIFLNNIFIANVPVNVTETLNANSSINLPLTAYFNPATVIKQGLQTLVSNPQNVTLTIKGKVSVQSSFIAINNLKINETIRLLDILKNK